MVHGHNSWDEATPICPFTLLRSETIRLKNTSTVPSLSVPECNEEDLRGGDARYNAMRLRRVLEGREHGAHRDAILLGTALALVVCGAVQTVTEGLQRAASAIDDGEGRDLLHSLAGSIQKDVVNG